MKVNVIQPENLTEQQMHLANKFVEELKGNNFTFEMAEDVLLMTLYKLKEVHQNINL